MRMPSPTPLLALAVALVAASACSSPDPGDAFTVEPPPRLETEVGVSVRGPAVITNIHPELDLIVADIALEPDDPSRLTWFGEGPWEIAPGDSRTIEIFFKPDAEGPLPAVMTVETDAGALPTELDLVGLPPVDDDGDGYSEAQGDCDDDNADVNPEATELCDGLDNDCDDDIDGPFDGDKDGFLDDEACPEDLGPLDCNDNDATAYPGHVEECDGSDSDCNGTVDDIDLLADLQDGVCEGAVKRCTAGGPVEPDYTQIEGYERLEFSCDEVDNDCDGIVDAFDRLGDGTSDCVDDDGDGEREVDGDCDDGNDKRTSANCGPSTLAVTRNDDGFATIDLNSGRVDLVSTGMRSYHGVALSSSVLWFAARDDGRIYRHDRNTGATLFSNRFGVSPWAVEVDEPSGDLLVLLGDGALQRRDPTDGSYRAETLLSGAPTAWTKAPDGTLWICTGGDGDLIHASVSRVLDIATITTACYGPPALSGSRLVVPGFDDRVLIELDTGTLDEVRARATDNQPVRAIWVGKELWVTTSVTRRVEIYEGTELLREEALELDGQTQGIWYDPSRDVVWVAVFGNDEVVGIDRRTREIKTRLPVPEPVYLFPIPPE